MTVRRQRRDVQRPVVRQVLSPLGRPCYWSSVLGQWVETGPTDRAGDEPVPSTELRWPRPMGWSEADVLEMPFLWEDGLPLSEARRWILAPIVESPTPMPPAVPGITLSERRVAA